MERYLYTHLPVPSVIHNSQNMEVTQVSINGWVDKQNAVYTHNRILSSLKKEGNSDTYCKMDEPWGHYAMWNKPATKGHTVWLHFYEVPRIIRFMEKEHSRGCLSPRVCMLLHPSDVTKHLGNTERRKWEFLFNRVKSFTTAIRKSSGVENGSSVGGS